MTRLRRQILLKAFKVSDLLIMVLSFSLAFLLVFQQYRGPSVTLGYVFSMRVKVENVIIFIGFLFVWHLILSSFGLYRSKRFSSRKLEIIDIIKASALGTVLLYVMAIIFKVTVFTPIFVFFFWIANVVILTISRLTMRYALSQVRIRGRNLRHILIVGANGRALNFAHKIESRRELGYRIIGFVDSDWTGISKFRAAGYKQLGSLEDFSSLIRNSVVDDVVICLPVKSFYDQASRIVALCEEQGITMIGCLPFDSVVTEAMVQGQPVTEFRPGSTISRALHDAWRQVLVAVDGEGGMQ